MFESFKARSEEIDQDKFNEFLNDPEFKKLVDDVSEKMIFSATEGDDEDEGAISFETERGYERDLGFARDWLDKKGVRITDAALTRAIARHMDPNGEAGFENLI